MILAGRTVLILEDEVIVAFALEDMLADMEASVVMATTTDEALDAVASGEFALAVLDVNVNGVKSYGVAAELAQRGVPIIFATGYGDPEHPAHFAAVPTLTKPYSRQQLADCIAAISRAGVGEPG